jgi:uncharacterized membrane protein
MAAGFDGKRPGRNGRHRFKLAEIAQQLVGGFLLAGPFVVTEEVWTLARNMSALQSAIVVGIIAIVGYASLYKADPDRDPEPEAEVGGEGVPQRFVSLMGFPSARSRCSRSRWARRRPFSMISRGASGRS